MRREITNIQRHIIKDPINGARHIVRHGEIHREQMALDTNEIRLHKTRNVLLARGVQHSPHAIIHDARVPAGRGGRPRTSAAGKPERAGQVTSAPGAGAVAPRCIDDLAAVVVSGLGLAHEAEGGGGEIAEGAGAVGCSVGGDAGGDAVAADILVDVAALLVATLAASAVVVADVDGGCERC